MEIKTENDPQIGPSEVLFEIIEIPTSLKKLAIWSNSETRQLMDLHKSFIIDVGPEKRFLQKKDMWLEISLQFPHKTPKQCEERFKTVLRRMKKGKQKGKIGKTDDLEAKCVENTFEIVRNPQIGHEIDDDSTAFKEVQTWTSSETKLLMSLHKSLICEVGKRFVYQKQMWTEISSHFPDKSPNQCLQRYKTVLRRKKKCSITKTRRKPVNMKAGDSIENTSKINSVLKIGNGESTKNIKELSTEGEAETQTQENDEAIKNKIDPISQVYEEPHRRQEKNELTLHELLLQITAKKEEAKERRHREKMDVAKQMQNILQQILNIKNI